jgi:actin-like ATPase involved in cell morphogenesis
MAKQHENIKTIRPLRDGVIADFQAAEHMMREMIKMIGIKNRFFSASIENGYLYPFRYHRGGRKSG